jgi:hypothetical protein
MTSISGSDGVTFNGAGATVNYTAKTATINGVTMTFVGFADFDSGNQPTPSGGGTSENVAQIVIQPSVNQNNSDSSTNPAAVTSTTLTSGPSSNIGSTSNLTTTAPLQENTNVFVGPACY